MFSLYHFEGAKTWSHIIISRVETYRGNSGVLLTLAAGMQGSAVASMQTKCFIMPSSLNITWLRQRLGSAAVYSRSNEKQQLSPSQNLQLQVISPTSRKSEEDEALEGKCSLNKADFVIAQ